MLFSDEEHFELSGYDARYDNWLFFDMCFPHDDATIDISHVTLDVLRGKVTGCNI